MPLLSIIICTYNRSDILPYCLDHLLPILHNDDKYEVIIVDNNSTDDTRMVVEKYMADASNIIYTFEATQGLSHGRNKGMEAASAPYLLYLDDDAKIYKASMDAIMATINNFYFDAFTGIYHAWHLQSPPKWLPHHTGNYILRGTNEVRELGSDHLAGGILVVKKSKLMAIGGFSTNLGMSGHKIAYGEETYMGEQFRARGWKLGINPHVIIDHLVNTHKYQLSWHLTSAYAHGRDAQYIKPINRFVLAFLLLKSILFGWLKPFAKWVSRPNYYIQNVIIDYIGIVLNICGSILAPINNPVSDVNDTLKK